jgi:hypothetical protein
MPPSDPFDGAGDATIEELIANDWAMAGKRLPPYVVDVHWLYKFRLFTLTLPRKGGWWTPRHSRTVTFLQGKVLLALWEHGIRRVTVSHLRSEDRIITTKLAEQLATADLDDGGTAIGLRYGSKHGND